MSEPSKAARDALDRMKAGQCENCLDPIPILDCGKCTLQEIQRAIDSTVAERDTRIADLEKRNKQDEFLLLFFRRCWPLVVEEALEEYAILPKGRKFDESKKDH